MNRVLALRPAMCGNVPYYYIDEPLRRIYDLAYRPVLSSVLLTLYNLVVELILYGIIAVARESNVERDGLIAGHLDKVLVCVCQSATRPLASRSRSVLQGSC